MEGAGGGVASFFCITMGVVPRWGRHCERKRQRNGSGSRKNRELHALHIDFIYLTATRACQRIHLLHIDFIYLTATRARQRIHVVLLDVHYFGSLS